MSPFKLLRIRDEAFAKIEQIYHDVTEGRWDNTNTAGQLRACVALHTAACEQLEGPDHVGDDVIYQTAFAMAVEDLRVAIHEKPHLKRELGEMIESLKLWQMEGGAS